MSENDPLPYDRQPNEPNRWYDSDEDWDQDQNRLLVRKFDEAIILAMLHAREAAQFLVDLMHGQVQDPHGDVEYINQRRLAADAILELAGLWRVLPGQDKENERDKLVNSLFNNAAD